MELKIKRIRKGIKQKDLAEKVGISQNLLSMYESGKRKPNHATLSKIADILGCDIKDIS